MNDVRPFSREALPWLRRSAAEDTLGLARWLSRSARGVRWELRGLGTLEARVESIDLDPRARLANGASPLPLAERFGLRREGLTGRLCVDGPTALALVHGLLGAGTPRVLRPLGRIERGVLAAIVAPLLAPLDLAGTLCLGPDAALADRCDGSLLVEYALRSPVASGRLCLLLPPAWMKNARPSPDGVPPEWMVTEASVELARTRLPRRELGRIEIGDAVVFDGALACGSSRWPCLLRIGSRVARAELDAAGELRLVGPFDVPPDPRGDDMPDHRSLAPDHEPPDDPGRDQQRRAHTDDVATVRLLAEAPVDLTAEIGRVRLRGDELVGLARGAVLALGRRRPEVTLRVGERVWGKGELVNVDDELGVRITSIEPRS
jgi:type III secretion system YscQ/HrcQ family protein